MTDPAALYEQRLTRLKTAIALGKPDKVPVIANADVFCAHHMGARMSRYSSWDSGPRVP